MDKVNRPKVFTAGSARRIARAVKKVEDGEALDLSRDAQKNILRKEIWAKVTSSTFDAGIWKHDWTQQREIADGGFEDMPGGISGDVAGGRYATDADPQTQLETGQTVRLYLGQRWDADSGKWVATFRVASGSDKGLYQGDIPQMVTDEQKAWGPAQFGP